MSNASNDVLYDRARDLIDSGLTVEDGIALNEALTDLDKLYELVKRLERKYLGGAGQDTTVVYKPLKRPENASESDMWPEEWASNYQKPEEYER